HVTATTKTQEGESLFEKIPSPYNAEALILSLCVFQVSELECVERTELKQTVEELEAELKAREEELETLREEVEKASQLQTQRDSLTPKLQETELKGAELLDLEQRLENSQLERESFRRSLRSLLDTLDPKILQLTELRDTLTRLMES
uniref:Uncharacterized protein n=1 Tax=Cyprinus carpio carpio TaxID=630221 RepID=A0A9J8CDZ1_CYPCA